MQLSEHFTLEEMCVSQMAARRGLDNTPGPEEIENLKRTAAAMEQVRVVLGGKAIYVDSGYRSPLVNASVGGMSRSAHCRGLACDFVVPEFGAPADVALTILRSDIEFDQLILEYGWVHVGLAEDEVVCRREVLTKRSSMAAYEPGIVQI